MSPHGYIDDAGRPVLVATIPAGDDPESVARADRICRDAWLAWADDCDDPVLRPVLLAAAAATGVGHDE